jgi:hypothetical protein
MPKSKGGAPQHNETDLKNRALAAYWRSGRPGEQLDPPSANGVALEEADGHLYVTIANPSRLLACYRVRNDGKLKYLRRPPVALKKER